MQIGANAAQAAGASLDLDYFAGDADNDVKAVASKFNCNGPMLDVKLNVSALRDGQRY